MTYQHGQQLGLTSKHRFTLFAGVILPGIAVTVEATTHICAQMFFDPIPTSWHMLLVILVPLAQLQVWFAIRRNDPNSLKLAGFANAVAIVISLFYSFIYVPLLPFAALTLLIALGLLPLAPFFALTTALIMRKQLRRVAAAAPKKSFPVTTKGFLISLGVGIAVIGVAELPGIVTRHGLEMAASASPRTRNEGIRFLRQYGNRDYLLQRCYDYRGHSLYVLAEWLSQDSPVKADEARDIYYRVTGEPFDAAPAPLRVNGKTIQQDDFDSGTGILKDLLLASSNLDGNIDADGGVGYLNWTLNFDNHSDSGKEARAEIQLPPGAVVTGATHWIWGVETETQFTGRSDLMSGETLDRRQPRVVVTTAGRDRVLVQTYPVPGFRNGIKIRLSIAVPLVLQSKDQARLILPYFNSRNFDIPGNIKHWILIDSNHPMNSDYGLAVHSVTRLHNNRYQMYGEFSDSELMRPETALRLARTDSDHGIWSQNPFEVDGSIVKQSLEERTPSHLRRIVLVIDTSASMAQWQTQIKSALNVLPSGMDVQLVWADADWLHESDLDVAATGGNSEVSMYLNDVITFAGGADNAPALTKAWDLATETPGNNAIVWIHSPQRTTLGSVEPLLNRMKGRFYGPSLYSVQTSAGSDEIVKKLDGINEVKSVVRLGSLRMDLERLFQQLSGQVPTLEFVRSVKHPQPDPNLDGVETSDHLAQLWANDEVARILGARDESLKEAATLLALRYKLVTPTSGAVIMDTLKQIDRGDLEPMRSYTFSDFGEADFGGLLFLAFLFFVWIIYAKVRRSVPASI
jgi:hypothetical protein